MLWQGGAVTRLTINAESEDSFAQDRYTFDPAGRVEILARRGHYIHDPFWTVTYRSDANGKLILTPASVAMMKKRALAKYQDYWLDWDKYPSLAKMPFAGLMTLHNGAITVRYACIKPHL